MVARYRFPARELHICSKWWSRQGFPVSVVSFETRRALRRLLLSWPTDFEWDSFPSDALDTSKIFEIGQHYLSTETVMPTTTSCDVLDDPYPTPLYWLRHVSDWPWELGPHLYNPPAPDRDDDHYLANIWVSMCSFNVNVVLRSYQRCDCHFLSL